MFVHRTTEAERPVTTVGKPTPTVWVLVALSILVIFVFSFELNLVDRHAELFSIAALFLPGLLAGYLSQDDKDFRKELTSLGKIWQTLSPDMNLSERVGIMLGAVREEFAAEAAGFLLDDRETEQFHYWQLMEHDFGAGLLGPAERPLFLFAPPAAALLYRSPGPVELYYLREGQLERTSEHVTEIPAEFSERFGLRSLLSVPTLYRGDYLGRLFVCNSPRDSTHLDDLAFLHLIAQHIQTQVENVLLVRQLRAMAVTAERARLARDLHDGVVQSLTGLNLQLETAKRLLRADPEAAEERVRSAQQVIRMEQAELRQFIESLRPVEFSPEDLAERIVQHARSFEKETGIHVHVETCELPAKLANHLAYEIFQIVREALANIRKHAEATQVMMELKPLEKGVQLVVDDNGRGFRWSGALDRQELERRRLGPIAIRERLRVLGGGLQVESNPGQGARLTIFIPLETNAGQEAAN